MAERPIWIPGPLHVRSEPEGAEEPSPPGDRTEISVADALRILDEGRLELVGLMPDASNYTFLAEARTDDGAALTVYKPRRGEAPLWDFDEGTLCLREVAAYRLAAALGWPAVPPTVLRDGPHGPGSVQLFFESDPDEHYFTLRGSRLRDFAPVAAFDVVANNADRKSGHCLLDPDGRIWVIDHGVCFHAEPKLRTVIWEFAGRPVPKRLTADLVRVGAALRAGPLRADLVELLSEREVDATARRAERLARTGRFPMPTSARPYPWPPV
jgi:uncharacterized repeat protein (TIGR03843 family)